MDLQSTLAEPRSMQETKLLPQSLLKLLKNRYDEGNITLSSLLSSSSPSFKLGSHMVGPTKNSKTPLQLKLIKDSEKCRFEKEIDQMATVTSALIAKAGVVLG
ncbi:hypothetical protein CFP56_006029 [Quercus suber]|uniref:Uncharacterized protein n=2 Tax=Quercus suber TaxID=58331 RepID=A0AAW0M783_QUESU